MNAKYMGPTPLICICQAPAEHPLNVTGTYRNSGQLVGVVWDCLCGASNLLPVKDATPDQLRQGRNADAMRVIRRQG